MHVASVTGVRPRVLVALFLAACSNVRNGVCYLDGEPDCGGTCPSYDDAVAELRLMPCEPNLDTHIEVGTCGAFRYTLIARGFGVDTEYFDNVGRIVAESLEAEGKAYCDGQAFIQHTGPELNCINVPTETFCPSP